MSGPRILAYSHDGYGLGHFRRNLRIATGVLRRRGDATVVLATGASAANRFDLPPRIKSLALPPLVKVGDGRYEPEDPQLDLDSAVRRRRQLLVDCVEEFRPDLLLVDRYPLGLHDELTDALVAFHRGDPSRPAVLGLRDVIDSPERVRAEWQARGHSDAIREHFRAVFVYGDRLLYDPLIEYELPAHVAAKVVFTGYLSDDPLAPLPGTPRVARTSAVSSVCTVGGGKDAFPVADAYMAAMETLAPEGWSGLMLAGPYMDATEQAHLRRRQGTVPVLPMVPDAPRRFAAAEVIVCMGGYNTMCEVLALGVPAVVVPRDHPRREQRIRVERLAQRGLVEMLPWEELDPEKLVAMMRRARSLTGDQLFERRRSVAGDGVATASALLVDMLPGGHLSTHAGTGPFAVDAIDISAGGRAR